MMKKNQKKIPSFQRLFFHFCLVGRPGTGRDRLSKSRPVPSRGKILSLSRCPFVPGQGRNFCPFVPKSCTVPSRWKRHWRVVQLSWDLVLTLDPSKSLETLRRIKNTIHKKIGRNPCSPFFRVKGKFGSRSYIFVKDFFFKRLSIGKKLVRNFEY